MIKKFLDGMRLHSGRNTNIAVLTTGALACVIWTFFAGKDLNWDLINYHYYLPFSLLHDRLTQDFFPANTQSYLNPVGYLPLYFLDRMGLPSFATYSVLAVLHSINIYLLFKISEQYSSDKKLLPILLATAIGLTTQPFWLEVGNSFLDILTTIPILLATLLLGQSTANNAIKNSFIAGLIFGLAVGLKPTNLIAAIPAVIFILFLCESRRLSGLFNYLAGGIIGTVLTGGYWVAKLYFTFGSPVFPLFNAVFHAPDFPPESLTSTRFLPEDAIATLLFPLRMSLIQTWVYLEGIAPDIRYATVFILLLAALGKHALNRTKHRSGRDLFARKELAFLVYFSLAYYLWVLTSANGRYGIPQLLLVGPALLITSQYLLPRNTVRILLAVVLIIQVFLLQGTLTVRWSRADWSAHIFDVEVPDTLTKNPYLFLSTSGPSSSYLAAYFHPDSAFVNVRSQHILTLEGPGGKKLTQLLESHSGKIRTLSGIPEDNKEIIDNWTSLQGGMYARYGLAIDRKSCITFVMRLTSSSNLTYLSCSLKSAPESYRRFIEETAPVDRVFDKIVTMCPKLFAPHYAPTEHHGDYWIRHYLNTEMNIFVENGQIIANREHTLAYVYLGHLDDWINNKPPANAKSLCTYDFDRARSLK